jgi:hypothetical protein
VLDRRLLEQLHGGELHARLGLPLQQVQHDRHGGQGGAGEEEGRQERQHQRSTLKGELSVAGEP